jgi:hypothetical protein
MPAHRSFVTIRFESSDALCSGITTDPLFSYAKTPRPALVWRAQPQHLGPKTHIHESPSAAAQWLSPPLLCGQVYKESMRMRRADSRLPPPRAAMSGRREAPKTVKCGARPVLTGKGTNHRGRSERAAASAHPGQLSRRAWTADTADAARLSPQSWHGPVQGPPPGDQDARVPAG